MFYNFYLLWTVTAATAAVYRLSSIGRPAAVGIMRRTSVANSGLAKLKEAPDSRAWTAFLPSAWLDGAVASWRRKIHQSCSISQNYDEAMSYEVETLSFESYRNGLIDQGFVNVGKGNFLSKELDIDRGQRTAVWQGPPLRELWTEETYNRVQSGVNWGYS